MTGVQTCALPICLSFSHQHLFQFMLIHRSTIFNLIDDIYPPMISSFIFTIMNQKGTHFPNYLDYWYLGCFFFFFSCLNYIFSFSSVPFSSVLFFTLLCRCKCNGRCGVHCISKWKGSWYHSCWRPRNIGTCYLVSTEFLICTCILFDWWRMHNITLF